MAGTAGDARSTAGGPRKPREPGINRRRGWLVEFAAGEISGRAVLLIVQPRLMPRRGEQAEGLGGQATMGYRDERPHGVS